MNACGKVSGLHGAEPCCRPRGHRGDHVWWITWEEHRCWKISVYTGLPPHRVKRYRGRFVKRPSERDVMRLISAIERAKKRERKMIAAARAAEPAVQEEPWPLPPPAHVPLTADQTAASRAARAAARAAA